MSKISFIKSSNRKYNIERVLSLIKSEIMSGLKDAKKVVVKPHCETDDISLASTNVDALAGVLEFIKPFTQTQIILAEGVTVGDTMTSFKNYGYFNLQEKYDFAVVDLNEDDYEKIPLFDKNGKLWEVPVAKTILEADYLISLAPPQTHNEVIFSGAIRNVAVGSIIRSSRVPSVFKFGQAKYSKFPGQSYKIINQNIKNLYYHTPVNLAIIDGYETMQADGPINGEMVPTQFAIASSDPLAADWLACQMINANFEDVGYLSLLEEEEEDKTDYFVVGDDWKRNITKCKMHSNFDKMKNWK